MTSACVVSILETKSSPWNLGRPEQSGMHVISQRRLREFWEKHADSEVPLRVWWTAMKRAEFRSSHEVKKFFSGVDFVGGGRAVFDIGGNKYRLVADLRYEWGRAFVVAVLTHEEYDRVDVTKL